MQPHAAGAGFVPGQLGAEDQPAVQSGGQHLAERLAVDRRGQGGGRVRVGGSVTALLVQALLVQALLIQALLIQDAQPLAHHRQPRARVTAGGLEHREGPGRQALLERQPGPRVDVQPVTLPPDGQVRIPFVHRDVDAGLQQALGQAEAAESAAGHGHPQTAHRPGPAAGSSPSADASPAAPGGFGIGAVCTRAASARVIACRIHQVAYVENL